MSHPVDFKSYLTDADKECVKKKCAVISDTTRYVLPFYLSLFTVGVFYGDLAGFRLVAAVACYAVFLLILNLIVLLIKKKRECTATAAVNKMNAFVLECANHISKFFLPNHSPSDQLAAKAEIAYAYVGLFSVYFQLSYYELPCYRQRKSNLFYKKKGNENPLFYLTVLYLMCNAAYIASAKDRTAAEERYQFYVETGAHADTFQRIGYEKESEKAFRSAADQIPKSIQSLLTSPLERQKDFERYLLTQFYALYPKLDGWEWKI